MNNDVWNKQHFVVQHDNLKAPLWMMVDEDGHRSAVSVNVWGPFNTKKDAEKLAETLCYNNQGWTFVVCQTDCAFQSTSTGVKRKIEGAE